MNPRVFFPPLRWIALLGLCFPLLSFAQVDDTASNVPERVVWNKAPIAIPLVVGEERLVHFPDSVSIGLPQSLTPLLRSQSINGTLYLLARQPFEPTRVMVRSETDSPIYVLDISAAPGGVDSGSLPDVQVLLQSPQKPPQDAGADQSTSDNRSQSVGYAALTSTTTGANNVAVGKDALLEKLNNKKMYNTKEELFMAINNGFFPFCELPFLLLIPIIFSIINGCFVSK